MSMVAALVTGVIRGMGHEELADWLENLPGKLGEEGARRIRSYLDEAGGLSLDGRKALEQWLDEEKNVAPALFSSLMVRESGASSSRIDDYLEVLNTIISTAKALGGPLVLQGFLHSEDCLSYWDFDSDQASSLSHLEKHPTLELINLGFETKIYILADSGSHDEVRALNLAIRKSSLRKLNSREYKYIGRPQVGSIHEFHVKFSSFGHANAEIPLEAPGMLEMIKSLAVAVEAQGLPKKALSETMAAIRDLGGRT